MGLMFRIAGCILALAFVSGAAPLCAEDAAPASASEIDIQLERVLADESLLTERLTAAVNAPGAQIAFHYPRFHRHRGFSLYYSRPIAASYYSSYCAPVSYGCYSYPSCYASYYRPYASYASYSYGYVPAPSYSYAYSYGYSPYRSVYNYNYSYSYGYASRPYVSYASYSYPSLYSYSYRSPVVVASFRPAVAVRFRPAFVGCYHW